MIPKLAERPAVDPLYRRFLDDLLQNGFTGHVGLNYADRLIHATDNSIYQVIPQAIIAPKDQEDLIKLFRLINLPQYQGIKITPRGGGTGTNGQALTRGLVIDLSRFMNQILDINLSEGWARVEPGVVLDQLNEKLRPQGYFFAPDLSPSNRATLGGMVNTDACGKGSRIYGKTSQHILELDLVLTNGEPWTSIPLEPHSLESVKQRDDRIGNIHRLVDGLAQEKQSLIRERYPDLARYLSGYNLKHIWDETGRFNLNYLIAGSEGTLALVTGMKVKLTPIPKAKALVLIKYENFIDSLKAARQLVATQPAAIETIDETILKLARGDNIWHQVSKFFSHALDEQVRSVNLVEFVDDDRDRVNEQVDDLCQQLTKELGIPHAAIGFEVARQDGDIAALWNLRKKGVGLLGNRPGQRRPIPFVEDTVVPPENLASYIAEFRQLLDDFGLNYGMFGHVDVGCLHVRPALDLKQEQDERLIRILSDRVKDLVLKYHGVIWGEHGKGFRGEYMPDFFGSELYETFRQIKGTFDPENRLNPGKLVSPLGSDEPIEKLDEVPLRAHFDRQIPAEVQTLFEGSINCNGNGACFNFQPHDVMCPSYKFSRDRIHSPKGRAGMIREWLRQLGHNNYPVLEKVNARAKEHRQNHYDFSHEVYDAMDGCLSCKACTSQCPIKVDIPDLKSKFLYHYHSRYRRPWSDYLIARTETLHFKLMKAPFLYNGFMRQRWFQQLVAKVTGMRDAPLLSSPNVYRLAQQRGFQSFDMTKLAKLSDEEKQSYVLIIPDMVSAFYEAPLVIRLMGVLRWLGFQPILTPYLENGKAKHVKGFLNEFIETATKTNLQLSIWSKLGLPMIGIDPAITLTYREEYPQYLGAAFGGYKVKMIQEWLSQELKSHPQRWSQIPQTENTGLFRLLGHCGEKTASPNYGKQWQEIFAAIGVKLDVAASGCCGMAGAFGHETRHYADSLGIYQMSWQTLLQDAQEKRVVLMATGASCRSQVERFSNLRLPHPLEVFEQIIKMSGEVDGKQSLLN